MVIPVRKNLYLTLNSLGCEIIAVSIQLARLKNLFMTSYYISPSGQLHVYYHFTYWMTLLASCSLQLHSPYLSWDMILIALGLTVQVIISMATPQCL